MHEEQGLICKAVFLWKLDKILSRKKRHLGPNLLAQQQKKNRGASAGWPHHGLWPSWRERRPVAGPAAVWPSSVDLEVDGPLQIEATPDQGDSRSRRGRVQAKSMRARSSLSRRKQRMQLQGPRRCKQGSTTAARRGRSSGEVVEAGGREARS